MEGQSPDGRGMLSPSKFIKRKKKFIKRSFECRATSTKHLNAGGEHQVARKAAQSLQKEVGQNIKNKNWDKRFRDGDPSWGGSREGREVSTQ